MKIIHVVPHVNAEASGPSYSVPRLCEALAAEGHTVQLSTLAAGRSIAGVHIDLHDQWPVLGRFAVSTSLARALFNQAAHADIVHNHSLWSMVNVASGWVVPGRGAKLVSSPRGTLSKWALGRNHRIKRGLWPAQRRVLDRADLIHATSDTEYQEIRQLGLKAPVAIIPNGIDIPEMTIRADSSATRTLLFLGRIHPIKGLDRLLEAWRLLQDSHQDWELTVAGVGDANDERAIRTMAERLRLNRVLFPGPLYGPQKSQAYRDASLFVLPTHSENFGVAVAEALAHACPAVVSRGAPWSGLDEEGCGWWVQNDVDSLVKALDSAMRLPPARLSAMGAKGRAWMEREYDWTAIAKKMSGAYDFVLTGGTAPQWLRTQ